MTEWHNYTLSREVCCPKCGESMSNVIAQLGPQSGDWCVCSKCATGHIIIDVDTWTLREITQDDLREIYTSDANAFNIAMTRLLTTWLWHEQKKQGGEDGTCNTQL